MIRMHLPMRMGAPCVASLGLVAVLASWPHRASAQTMIDNRINTGNADAGRLHDANPLIGSGGYNPMRPTIAPGLRANSIITGNVTGLGAFHGDSPIVQNNAFRGTLPSTGLSEFYRRSVGLDNLGNRDVALPSLFLDPRRTVADVGFMRQGLNLPGSSVVSSPYLTPPSWNASPPTLTLPVEIPDPIDLRLRHEQAVAGLGLRHRPNPTSAQPGLSPGGAGAPSMDMDWYRQAADSTIFGPSRPRMPMDDSDRLRGIRYPSAEPDLPRPPKDQRPGGERHAQDTRIQSPQTPFPETGQSLEAESAARSTRLTPIRSRPTGTLYTEGEGEPRPTMDSGLTLTQLRPTADTKDATGAAGADDLPGVPVGSDRFADLYHAVEEAMKAGNARLGFVARRSRAEPPSGAATAPPTPAMAPESAEEGSGRPGDTKPPGSVPPPIAPQWAKNLLDDPVTTFAGTYASTLNKCMAKGEAALHKGDYYAAAGEFKLAETIDPRNPLPILARGNALLAAGDYVSAARQLLKAIRIFPQIAAFNLDLPSLVGNKEVFDLRRVELEDRLKLREDAELRFLLGYIELYSGLPELGLNNLARAAETVPPESPIRTFHVHVQGGADLPALGNDPAHRPVR